MTCLTKSKPRALYPYCLKDVFPGAHVTHSPVTITSEYSLSGAQTLVLQSVRFAFTCALHSAHPTEPTDPEKYCTAHAEQAVAPVPLVRGRYRLRRRCVELLPRLYVRHMVSV
jgi:hypothetical protein